MTALALYVTDDCCLCDEAVAILAEVRAPDFECVGIDDDPALVERYGIRVPVLHHAASGRELGWPFDAEAARRFLAAAA